MSIPKTLVIGIYLHGLLPLNENGFSSSEHTARGNISYALNGRYKSSCGFKWILNEQPDLENAIWKNVTIN